MKLLWKKIKLKLCETATRFTPCVNDCSKLQKRSNKGNGFFYLTLNHQQGTYCRKKSIQLLNLKLNYGFKNTYFKLIYNGVISFILLDMNPFMTTESSLDQSKMKSLSD